MGPTSLIIGFTFAMALSHYDAREDLEGAEAMAISAEYARADLLPADAAAHMRDLSAGTCSDASSSMKWTIRISSSRSGSTRKG